MTAVRRIFRDPEGLWPNLTAMVYITVTYFGGWFALLQGTAWSWLAGILLIAHGMTIAAYLMHDCGHNAVFASTTHNTWLGRILNSLCGSDYGTYEDMRYKHMRHHVDNCEPVRFDYRNWLKAHPILHRIVNALEWAYIPAVEFLMHGMQIAAPFVYPELHDQRRRVIIRVLVRAALFVAIALYAPMAALGYLVAYVLFITILRFMDNFQHSYQIYYQLHDPAFMPPEKGNRAFEESHTYSNLLSERWPWLNLLVLNFCYHNAHHTQPTLSWHRLPALHERLYPEHCPQQLHFWPQLASFHKHRVARVLSEDYGSDDVVEALAQRRAVGVNALSFLTAF